jgi:hypothetical protein
MYIRLTPDIFSVRGKVFVKCFICCGRYESQKAL